ncbi:PIN domain-containing protein [Microbacterium enclense]|uniref:PIN domain-containing protein n=1 Tax=Microbacterium enclense TaxID=993073 RepID=UPI003F7EA701
MLTVVLDTNAVHRDPWLTRDDAPKLVHLASSGTCEIVYPRVVIRELTRQRVERAREAHDAASAGVTQMGAAGISVAETATLLQNAHDRIEADIDDAFDAVLSKTGIRDLPIPKVSTTDLLDRDLGRRRPFLEIEQGKTRKSLGFRDVLIWESVLELLEESDPGDMVLFATFDGGFLADDKKALHSDLLGDLARLGIPQERVRLARGIPEAISLVESLVADTVSPPSDDAAEAVTSPGTTEEAQIEEPAPSKETSLPAERELSTAEEPDDAMPTKSPVEIAVDELKQMRPQVPHAALVETATDALYGLVNEEVSEQLGYGDDAYPPFVKFTVPSFLGATIADIDQTTEFSFDESSQSPDVLVGTAEAVITLEGAVYRADWLIADRAVSITGEPRDLYLDASAEVEVKVVVEIDIEGGEPVAMDIVLEDLPAPLVRSAHQLELEFSDVESSDAGDEGSSDGS